GLETGERLVREPADFAAFAAIFRDGSLWTRLNEAASVRDFAAAWLDIQCRMMAGVGDGVLLVRDEQGKFAPAAAWPAGTVAAPALVAAAEVALTERRGALGESGDASAGPTLAYPVLSGDDLSGAVAVALDPGISPDLKPAMRQLQWGVGIV